MKKQSRVTTGATAMLPARLSWWLPVAIGLAVALLALAARPAFAHGEEVTVEPAQAKHGETITVSGKEFPADRPLTISLDGARDKVLLGEVTTNADGDFSVQFTIPEEATPGSYQLKVVGADEPVTLDFSVLEEAGGASASSGARELVFQRSTAETIAIAVIALAMAAAGTVLVLAGRGPGHRAPG